MIDSYANYVNLCKIMPCYFFSFHFFTYQGRSNRNFLFACLYFTFAWLKFNILLHFSQATIIKVSGLFARKYCLLNLWLHTFEDLAFNTANLFRISWKLDSLRKYFSYQCVLRCIEDNGSTLKARRTKFYEWKPENYGCFFLKNTVLKY